MPVPENGEGGTKGAVTGNWGPGAARNALLRGVFLSARTKCVHSFGWRVSLEVRSRLKALLQGAHRLQFMLTLAAGALPQKGQHRQRKMRLRQYLEASDQKLLKA